MLYHTADTKRCSLASISKTGFVYLLFATWLVFYYQTLGKQIILHFLWCIASLPIVTIPPATSALCSSEWRLASGEKGNILTWFLKDLKKNFLSSYIPFVVAAPLFSLAIFNIYFYLTAGSFPFWAAAVLGSLQIAFVAAILLTFPVLLAVFPVRAGKAFETLFDSLKLVQSKLKATIFAYLIFFPVVLLAAASTVGLILLLSSMCSSMAIVAIAGQTAFPVREEYKKPALLSDIRMNRRGLSN